MSLILGLDISSSVIGWSILEKDGEKIQLVEYGNLKPLKSSKGSLCIRVSSTFDMMLDFLKEKSPEEVCVEAYANKFSPGRSTARTIIVLSVFNELVCMASYKALGIEPERYPVSTIRASMSKYYNEKISSKEEVFDFVCDKFPNFQPRKGRTGNIKKECFDEADAIAVALTHIIKKEK